MNRSLKISTCAFFGAVCLLLAGCLSRPALVRQTYALQVPSATNSAASGDRILAIRTCRVSPLFAGRSLVYRTGPNTFETDPYAGFLVSPDDAIEIPVRTYLRKSGSFKAVVEPGSTLKADSVLEIHVTELYGDFRTKQSPSAVLSLRAVFFEAGTKGGEKVLFQRDYSRVEPLSENRATAVVAGWNQALSEILSEINTDLVPYHNRKADQAAVN